MNWKLAFGLAVAMAAGVGQAYAERSVELVCTSNPSIVDKWDCEGGMSLKEEATDQVKVEMGAVLKGQRLKTLADRLQQELKRLKHSRRYAEVVGDNGENLGAEDFSLEVETFRVVSNRGQLDSVALAEVAGMKPSLSRMDIDWIPETSSGNQIQKTPLSLADALVPEIYDDESGLMPILSDLAASVQSELLAAVKLQPNLVILHVSHSSEPACNSTGCESAVIYDKFNAEGMTLQMCSQYR